jgi:hypothetical protein
MALMQRYLGTYKAIKPNLIGHHRALVEVENSTINITERSNTILKYQKLNRSRAETMHIPLFGRIFD